MPHLNDIPLDRTPVQVPGLGALDNGADVCSFDVHSSKSPMRKPPVCSHDVDARLAMSSTIAITRQINAITWNEAARWNVVAYDFYFNPILVELFILLSNPLATL